MWLFCQIAIMYGIELFLIVNYWFTILNGSISQTFIVSVNLDKLTYIEILLDMWTPNLLDRCYLIFELSKSTSLATRSLNLILDDIHLQFSSAFAWSWQYKWFRCLDIHNFNFRPYFNTIISMIVIVPIVISVAIITISIRMITIVLAVVLSRSRSAPLSATTIISPILLHYLESRLKYNPITSTRITSN